MFFLLQNMRFYNVLLNDKFCINVDHFKLIYSVLEIIYVFYIDENYCFITFKHILKKLMKIFLFLWIFDTFLKISKIPQFFAPKHAVLQRTLKWWFFHQRGALQAGIHVSRVNIYAPYCRKSFFLSFLHIFEKFQKIFKQISWIFDNFSKICWNFDFFEFHSPYLWVKKMCLVCAQKMRKFFFEKYDKYVKNFYYYYLLKHWTGWYIMLERAFQKFRCFWLFLAKSTNPPNYAKWIKFSVLLQT